MNTLSPAKQAQVIAAICEGASIRAAARQAEVSKNTVTRLIVNVATAVNRYQDEAFRNLDIQRIEADEIWAGAVMGQSDDETVMVVVADVPE